MVEPNFRGLVNGFNFESLNLCSETAQCPFDYQEAEFYCKAQIDRDNFERRSPLTGIVGKRIDIPKGRRSGYISYKHNSRFFPKTDQSYFEEPIDGIEGFCGENTYPSNCEPLGEFQFRDCQFIRRNSRNIRTNRLERDSIDLLPVKKSPATFGRRCSDKRYSLLQINGIGIEQVANPQCLVNECALNNSCLCEECPVCEIDSQESVKDISNCKASGYPIRPSRVQRQAYLEHFEKKIVEPKLKTTPISHQKKEIRKPLEKSTQKHIPEKPKPAKVEKTLKPSKIEKPFHIDQPLVKENTKKKETVETQTPPAPQETSVIEIPIVMAPSKVQSPKISQISHSKSVMTEELPEEVPQNIQPQSNAKSSQTSVNEKVPKQQRCCRKCSGTYLCVCSICGGCGTRCCCTNELGGIEEDQVPFDMACESYTDFKHRNPCQKCQPPHRACEEEDPCGELFDAMRDTMEDAVKKSFEDVFGRYFASCMKRMEQLSCQIERTECLLKNICSDLNGRICFYGRRSAQQFQYIYMQMEHQKHLFKKQQECLRNVSRRKARCERPKETCDRNQRNSSDDSANETCISCERLLPRVQTVSLNKDGCCEDRFDDDRSRNRRCTDTSNSRSSKESKYEDAECHEEQDLCRYNLKPSKSSITKNRSNETMLRKVSSTGSRSLLQARSRIQM